MTDLEKLRAWLGTYPGYDILSAFRCDYTDQVPSSGAVFPAGLVEIARREDILGNVTVEAQYNWGLYYVFEKTPGDDAAATVNADWVMNFQQWVQEQSVRGLAPRFGNVDGERETMRAQNGALYTAEEEGTATYMVVLSAQFKKYYEVT